MLDPLQMYKYILSQKGLICISAEITLLEFGRKSSNDLEQK